MRREPIWITARRHLFDHDVRKLEVEPPRSDGGNLSERRILDDSDRSVGRFTAMAIDDLPKTLLVVAEDCGQQANRTIQIFGVFADDRDAVRMAVLDQNLAVAIEYDPTWR